MEAKRMIFIQYKRKPFCADGRRGGRTYTLAWDGINPPYCVWSDGVVEQLTPYFTPHAVWDYINNGLWTKVVVKR